MTKIPKIVNFTHICIFNCNILIKFFNFMSLTNTAFNYQEITSFITSVKFLVQEIFGIA